MAEGLRVRDEDDRPAGLGSRATRSGRCPAPDSRARERSGGWTCRPWWSASCPPATCVAGSRSGMPPPPSRSPRCALWRWCEMAIATAAPAAATTSVASGDPHPVARIPPDAPEPPATQPRRASRRRRAAHRRIRGSSAGRRRAPRRSAGRFRRWLRSRTCGCRWPTSSRLRRRLDHRLLARRARRATGRSSGRSSTGAGSAHRIGSARRGVHRAGARRSRRAVRRCRRRSRRAPASRSSRNPPRRYISTSSPPRSRSVSSRALSSVRRSRRSTPACARRGATPADPLARRRNTRLECRCPLGWALRAG